MRRRSLAAILALVTVALAVHATALSGWWLYDDPQLLIEAILQPILGALFDPAQFTHLASHTFSPMQLLSIKLDLLLFGLNATPYYAHQLIAIALAAILFYLLLRHYVPDLYGALGAGVFLMTWMAVYATRTLMIRHYVEGLAFALAAMLAWRRGGRWTIVAAILYLLALLSKEVYATIPIFFVCQSRFAQRSWREIARELIAPATAAIVFLIWRWRMTGLIGGYTNDVGAREIESFPRAIWSHIVGPVSPWTAVVWAIAIVVSLGLLVWRYRGKALAFIVVSLLAMTLPIVSLAANFEWRYSFAFVAFLVAILTLGLGLARLRWPVAILIALLATTAFTSIRQREYFEKLTRSTIEQEGRYVWTQPPNAPTLFAQSSPGWYLGGLAWLRKHEGRDEGPQAVFSDYAITVGGFNPSNMVKIDDARIVPITRSAGWDEARRKFDPTAPLAVDFALSDHYAQWRLGPPAAKFVFLTVPGYTAIPIPASGRQRVPAAREQQFFQMVREEAGGRWTVSPVLPVPAAGAATIWQRRH